MKIELKSPTHSSGFASIDELRGGGAASWSRGAWLGLGLGVGLRAGLGLGVGLGLGLRVS